MPKTTRAAAHLTLQEAADALGVHYMTAYRYVRLGLLAARKEGSTWRVSQSEVDRFASQVADTPSPTTRRRAPWAVRLEARLLAGDGRGSWGVVEAALAAGATLAQIHLEILAPALASIGERWERGDVDVAAEHRATGIVQRILGRLGARFSRRGRSRGTVLIGTAEGERHSLPAALVADLVRADGFDVSDLGGDLPAEAFAAAALRAERLVAVGVSATIAGNERGIRRTVKALRSATPVPVLLGGAAIDDADHASRLGADGFAPDGLAACAMLDDLANVR